MKQGKKDCLKDCITYKEENLGKNIIIPFEIDNKEIQKLFSYFLYSAPEIESVHSNHISKGNNTLLFEALFSGRHYTYRKICSSNTVIDNELKKVHLEGDKICVKCKRFVIKRKKTNKGEQPEADLVCFLRHIRNSIAHGRVYYLNEKGRIHIVFEDRNEKNVSARIVCVKADLEHWKKVLSCKESIE